MHIYYHIYTIWRNLANKKLQSHPKPSKCLYIYIIQNKFINSSISHTQIPLLKNMICRNMTSKKPFMFNMKNMITTSLTYKMLKGAHAQKVQIITTCSSTQKQKKQLLHYSLELQDLARWGEKEITTKCHLLTHMQMQHFTSL